MPSPVVELNRAVAVAMAFGPAAGLELVDGLSSEPSLQAYHLLPSVRGAFCLSWAAAANLTRNARERDLLLDRARTSAQSLTPPS
jgi:predicted RNA polymerase sigma factor